MYTIYYNDEAIASDSHPHFPIISGKLSQKLNTADEFAFTLPQSNTKRDIIRLRQGIIKLKKNGILIFVGDVIAIRKLFDKSVEYVCQGCLAWFNDTVNLKIPIATQTVQMFFSSQMARYDDQKEKNRVLLEGVCTVTGNVSIGHPKEYTSLFDTLSEMIELRGGTLIPRYKNDEVFIDYIKNKTGESTQRIEFGKNLINLEDYITAQNLTTAVYPVGNDGITIADVNPTGKVDLVNDALRAQYGKISRAVKFDTDSKDELLELSEELLNSLAVIDQSITLSAVDLSLIDSSVDSIEIADKVRVVSALHGLDTTMMCSEKTVDITAPTRSTITLGKSLKSISKIVAGK